MSDQDPEVSCRNCGRPRAASTLDQFGWCTGCRAVVIRRATLAARVSAAIVLAVAAYVVFSSTPNPRFLVLWLVILVALYFAVYKITQRVAFEVIRSRGVPPPQE